MFHNLAESITKLWMKENTVDLQEREVYVFGLEVLLLNGSNIMTAFLLSVLTKSVEHFAMFLMVFVPLRISVGGFHAKSSGSCYVATTVFYMATVILSKQALWFADSIEIGVLLAAMILIIRYAPCEHVDHPLEREQRNWNRRQSIILTVMDSLIFILLRAMGCAMAVSIVIFVTAVSVLMILGMLTQKRKYNKGNYSEPHLDSAIAASRCGFSPKKFEYVTPRLCKHARCSTLKLPWL